MGGRISISNCEGRLGAAMKVVRRSTVCVGMKCVLSNYEPSWRIRASQFGLSNAHEA